jgi:aryl-phospho-beta-D-glucosidase BglC (GH1 family)
MTNRRGVSGPGIRRRDFLAGMGVTALSLAGARSARSQERGTTAKAIRARRLARGLTASFWFEWVPTGDAAEMRKRIGSWYRPEDFAQIRALGFDHVRVSLQPDFTAPKIDNGDADLSDERLEILDRAVKPILDNDLTLVLDNHASTAMKDKIAANDSFRNAATRWWRNFSGHVAHQGQYTPENTLFELLNEPEASFDDVERYRTAMGQFISAVRASAPDYTVVVGGNRWNVAEAIYDGLKTPFADPNLVYTFHFYFPKEFTHQGIDSFGPFYQQLRNVPWDVGPGAMSESELAGYPPSVRTALEAYNRKSHRKADLRGAFERLKDWCDGHGEIAWLGEFGVYSHAARPEQRAAWIRDVRELAEEHGFGWAMWEARGGFGLFLPDDSRPLKVDEPVLRALGL